MTTYLDSNVEEETHNSLTKDIFFLKVLLHMLIEFITNINYQKKSYFLKFFMIDFSLIDIITNLFMLVIFMPTKYMAKHIISILIFIRNFTNISELFV